ncbi:MAG TPA: tetraacyldisaccharide 4'-kinase [Rhabdochlamydiaceae bacterium]|nr:tetraacyldisaccharide 4'-kinase [Rhabdochlamydiaceae bacterium]
MTSKILQIIEEDRKAPLIKVLLQGMSQCYRAGVALRNFAYDQELFVATKVALPVISVGNIVAGGTGKTPFVRLLAGELLKIGKVAILSRGYRSAIEKSGKVARLDEQSSAEAVGDEPVFLARKLKEAMVFSGKKRVQAVKEAAAQGAEIIVLDDGMQHRKLERDIEIAVMDGQDLFGKGFYLPRGFLRDSPKRLREADFIVVNSVKNEEQWNIIKAEIKKYSSAPLIGVELQPMNHHEIKGKRVGAFCGIAKPLKFMKTLKEAGADIVETMITLDHLSFPYQDLCLFSGKCKAAGAELLVCTEKDAVKLADHLDLSLPVVALKTELKIFSGEAYFIDLLQKVKLLWSHYHERRV